MQYGDFCSDSRHMKNSTLQRISSEIFEIQKMAKTHPGSYVRSNHITFHTTNHNYFSKLIIYIILNSESITAYQPITKIFKFSFSPCNIGESNKLQIRNSSNHVYINYLLSFIRPSAALI